MIVHDNISVETKGKDVTVKQHVVTNNMDLLQFAAMMRALPPEKRKGFFKECRVKAVIPMYLPKGMFNEHEHFGHLLRDPDKLDYLLREAPEFRTVDDPCARGAKVVVHGGA